MTRIGQISVVVGMALVLAGCAVEPEPSGERIFFAHCVDCHGSDGKGDGWVAAGLTRKPADLTGLSARNGGVFPLARVLNNIDGFHRHAPRGSVMPEFGAIFGTETTQIELDGVATPVPVDLLAVTQYLETIQK